jgi:putative ABC transport system permease protein
MPRLPLALRLLIHTPGRLAVSVAGILLAIVLMFSQAGFRYGVLDSQAELIRRLNGELVIIGRLKSLMYVPEPFARRRLPQARAVPGVRSVAPLYIESDRAVWQNPADCGTRSLSM